MEKLLRRLFDYQKFAKNERIEKMVQDLEDVKQDECLPEEALSFVTGGTNQENKENKGEKA